MKNRIHLLCLLVIACAIPAAHATVGFLYSGDALNFEADELAPNGSLVVLLANVGTPTTAGTGFSTLTPGSLNIGGSLNGGLYQVIDRTFVQPTMAASGGFLHSVTDVVLTSDPFPNLSVGDQLAVAWFPTLSFDDDLILVAGTAYGLFTIDDSIDWKVPVDGFLANNLFVPDGATASHTVSAIPEPSTYAALLGLAVLGFAAYRRRSRAG